MIKKNKSTLILIFVFVVGLGVLLYPTVANWWNNRAQMATMRSYTDALENMDAADYEEAFAKADKYNEELAALPDPLVSYEKVEGYEDTLNIAGNGVIGILTIPRISIELPVYHGTDNSVLSMAVGHMQGSSLPVGGEGTHAVLSAHRGLPSAKLFSDLDDLEEGDTFTIQVLDRLLTYEVDQIRTVEPDEAVYLTIEEGKDFVTLLTCTPYGLNTHRLLVRGVRTENAKVAATVTGDAYKLDSAIVAPLVAAILLGVLMIYLVIRDKKRRK